MAALIRRSTVRCPPSVARHEWSSPAALPLFARTGSRASVATSVEQQRAHAPPRLLAIGPVHDAGDCVDPGNVAERTSATATSGSCARRPLTAGSELQRLRGTSAVRRQRRDSAAREVRPATGDLEVPVDQPFVADAMARFGSAGTRKRSSRVGARRHRPVKVIERHNRGIDSPARPPLASAWNVGTGDEDGGTGRQVHDFMRPRVPELDDAMGCRG